MSLAQSTANSEPNAIAHSPDWRTAVTDLLNFWIQNGRSFSSGEIAAVLRTFRPDLRFSVPKLGEHVRDLFYNQGLPEYDDGAGFPVYPVQVPRTTQGIGRTPPGLDVFVYGYCEDDARNHDFEVDIPDGHSLAAAAADGLVLSVHPQAQVPASTPASAGPATPVPLTAPATPKAFTARADSSKDAYIGSDNRCYIPRRTVEAFLHKAGVAVRPGRELFVTTEPDKAIVTLDTRDGAKGYALWKSTGRLAFYSQGGVTFTEGHRHPVTVEDDKMVVDFSVTR